MPSKTTPTMRLASKKHADNINKRGLVPKTLVRSHPLASPLCQPPLFFFQLPTLPLFLLSHCVCTRLIAWQAKKDYDYPVGPMMLAFFVFVVIGSGTYSWIHSPPLYFSSKECLLYRSLTLGSHLPSSSERSHWPARVKTYIPSSPLLSTPPRTCIPRQPSLPRFSLTSPSLLLDLFLGISFFLPFAAHGKK